MLQTIRWNKGRVILIDQTQLPQKLKYVKCTTCEDVAKCIENMNIRGAPALGVAAAYGLALVAYHSKTTSKKEIMHELENNASRLRFTRPTAENLFRAINRIISRVGLEDLSVKETKDLVIREALRIAEEDKQINRAIGKNEAKLLKDGSVVLTHCNTGFLATSGVYGTALGVVKVAHEQGKRIRVIATETRPLLQGARLTAWELKREGIPVTVITDSMTGYCFSKKLVDLVMVGADRIAANGDVVNKIGTYSIAVLARAHRVPFYVVAPTSTIDLKMRSGRQIPIEQRSAREVTFIGRKRVVPRGVDVLNPAFDLTPAGLVTAIVTERGVVKPGKVKSLFRP